MAPPPALQTCVLNSSEFPSSAGYCRSQWACLPQQQAVGADLPFAIISSEQAGIDSNASQHCKMIEREWNKIELQSTQSIFTFFPISPFSHSVCCEIGPSRCVRKARGFLGIQLFNDTFAHVYPSIGCLKIHRSRSSDRCLLSPFFWELNFMVTQPQKKGFMDVEHFHCSLPFQVGKK